MKDSLTKKLEEGIRHLQSGGKCRVTRWERTTTGELKPVVEYLSLGELPRPRVPYSPEM